MHSSTWIELILRHVEAMFDAYDVSLCPRCCRAGDLMQDLKTGHLIRASPRAQFYGQLIGSCLSIVVTTTAYTLYQRAYEIPGPSFPAPTAFVWLGLARLLRTYAFVFPASFHD